MHIVLACVGGVVALATIARFLHWLFVERPRNRRAAEAALPAIMPFVYADLARIKASNKVDAQLPSDSAHVATRTSIELS
jgi:hypothetical protein